MLNAKRGTVEVYEDVWSMRGVKQRCVLWFRDGDTEEHTGSRA